MREGRETDQVFQVAQREPFRVFQVVLQPTRGRDDNVRLLGERDLLGHRVHASDDGRDADADPGPERGELVRNLIRQLAVAG